MLSSSVLIKQSQTDRKPVGYEPVKLVVFSLNVLSGRFFKVKIFKVGFAAESRDESYGGSIAFQRNDDE